MSMIMSFVITSFKQVAQLWQRVRAKLDTFSIKVQRYSQNHAYNCIFAPCGGIGASGGLRVTYAIHFKLVGKLIVDFP